jgi:hypothetical protein
MGLAVGLMLIAAWELRMRLSPAAPPEQ